MLVVATNRACRRELRRGSLIWFLGLRGTDDGVFKANSWRKEERQYGTLGYLG